MQRWTIQLEGGPRRVNHAAIAYGDSIFTFGGYCTGEDYTITRPMDTHRLNTVSFRWTALPLPEAQHGAVPFQRYGHTAVCFMDCAYIWGGRNDEDGACNTLYCFDMTRYQWSKVEHNGLKPGARDGHSACLIGPKMYIFGGFVEQVQRFSNDVHYMDLATMTWNQVRTKGIPARFRDFHSATAIGNVMYVFGGRSDLSGHNHTGKEFYDDHIIMFDTITNRWLEHVQADGRPMGRRSHSAFTYNDELYIFGGYNGDTREHFRDLHKFNPKSQTWSAFKVKGFGPSARRRQCCCVIGSKAFLFGGTSPRPEPLEGTDMELVDLSDMHILDFAPTLKTICMLAVLQFNLDQSCLPCDVRWDLSAMTTNNTITRPMNSALG